MKKYIFVFVIFSIFLIGCSTIRNSSGYKIKIKRSDYYTNGNGTMYMNGFGVAYDVFCDNKNAYSIFNLNDISYLRKVGYDGKHFYVIINERKYNIDVNKIKPENIAKRDYDLLVKQSTGFNTYEEYIRYIEQKKIEDQRIKNEEKRLSDEVDAKYGVVSVVSLYDAKVNKLRVGYIYRLKDIFFAGMSTSPETSSSSYYMFSEHLRLRTGAYIFGEFSEYEIRGLNMENVDVKKLPSNWRMSLYANIIGPITFGGNTGYIVKYLGTEQVITQAGLIKIIWVFECIGGNKYVQ